MIDMDTYTPPAQAEADVSEEEKQLIPLSEPESEEEKAAEAKPKDEPSPETMIPHRTVSSRLFTAVCAFFCILTVTLSGIGIADAFGRTSTQTVMLRLTNRALLGLSAVHITEFREEVSLPRPTLPSLSENPAPPAVTEETTEAAERPPEGTPNTAPEYPIIAADLAGIGDVHTLSNETRYEPDTEALLNAALPFPDLTAFQGIYGTNAPYILIVHTHGTEAYTAAGADSYTSADSFRSTDTTDNVVAVGAALAEALTEAGIPVIHCTEMFDAESYSDAYSLSAAAVRRYLAEYPSIQIVLDVHRDSIVRADSAKLRPVTEVGGEDTAQVMIVVGTDAAGANHKNWKENLSFALKLQNGLLQKHSRFARPINLRAAGFNQQYTSGSLLLEIGSCGNTLDEAKRAATLFGAAIAEAVIGDGKASSLAGRVPPKGNDIHTVISHGTGCTCDFCLYPNRSA